jgi:acyl-CoA synthetase (AMP-forming)/AMP-acid ligase II
MGYKDEDGFFYLVDRKQNMIITGGENVYPSEVENILIMHPAVKEVCVIGVPDEKWGESVKAVVVLNDDVEAGEDVKTNIIDFCRDKMAGYKRPRSGKISAPRSLFLKSRPAESSPTAGIPPKEFTESGRPASRSPTIICSAHPT